MRRITLFVTVGVLAAALCLFWYCASMSRLRSEFSAAGFRKQKPFGLIVRVQFAAAGAGALCLAVGTMTGAIISEGRRGSRGLVFGGLGFLLVLPVVWWGFPRKERLLESYCSSFAKQIASEVQPQVIASRLRQLQSKAGTDNVSEIGPPLFPEWGGTSDKVSVMEYSALSGSMVVAVILEQCEVGVCLGGEPLRRPVGFDYNWHWTNDLWVFTRPH